MSNLPNDLHLQVEKTCGYLLHELKIIWDEIGETDAERHKTLLELEQECLEIYRRKVDQTNKIRAQLRQAITDSEAEIAAICSSLGEQNMHIRQPDQNLGSLREELSAILPQLEEIRKMKCDRRNQFLEVLEQIQIISYEIYSSSECSPSKTTLDETDLSLIKLEELRKELQTLQAEKSNRLRQVLDHLSTLNSLCLVFGMDFQETVNEIHPSLGDSNGKKNISNDTIEQLANTIERLRQVKIQRMQQLQDLATSLLELWNLMDTPFEEQQMFQSVTCNIAASEHEITEPNMLSVDFINYVEAEVSRLEELKTSKMKELVLKKRSELDEICKKTHVIPELDSTMEIAIEAIESGTLDPACVLDQIELQIAKVKEEAFSRKEILEKVEKWLAVCEEENWLEEYNADENRYHAGRGVHLTLKRAEKARALVNKLPGMVESLAAKTTAWETERGIQFTYDGVHLLSMLEEYTTSRQEKEQERKRQRDQKKLQGQLTAEKETPSGSKPGGKKVSRMSSGGGHRRLSTGGFEPIQATKPSPNTRVTKKNNRLQDDGHTTSSAGDLVDGFSVKKNFSIATSARELESTRKPFSSIPSTEPNPTNSLENLNGKPNEILQKAHQSNQHMPFDTPSNTTSAEEWGSTTPKTKSIPPPSTPSATSAPRHALIASNPTSDPNNVNPVEEIDEGIEYSFEERRAGFVLS